MKGIPIAIMICMNKVLDEKLKTLPLSPGVYFHKSKTGEIIYIGKAAVLKNRVRQYFQNSRSHDTKTMALVSEISDTDWVETGSEVDALFLESEMVKRYKPRYNILLRDDKSQLFVRINTDSEWPHVSFTRNPADDRAEYFGPFYNGVALRKALRYLRRIFPYYTREPGKNASKLDEDLGLVPSRADGSDAYHASLKKLISYVKGNRTTILKEIENDMKQAALTHQFELAANFRNKLRALHELQRRVTFGDQEFLDISKDKALSDLTNLMKLPTQPSRIEAFDISHQGGKDVVAGMVVFTNGVSDRAEYRKFKLSRQANDDVGSMREIIIRRFSSRNLKSWGRPGLIVIDGGKSQLKAATEVLKGYNLTIPCLSIAKREEEIILHQTQSNIDTEKLTSLQKQLIPGVSVIQEGEYFIVNLHVGQRNASAHSKNLGYGTSLSPYDDVVKLFQRIRDEAHRFAVSYHTVLKRATSTRSILDTIPGIGPVTRKALIKKFGSVSGIEKASQAELQNVVGRKKAKLIKNNF
jgi:excinuclease ABC subunit C